MLDLVGNHILTLLLFSLPGEVRDMPVALHIPVLYPCMASEELRITIDSQRGTYLASLPSHGELRKPSIGMVQPHPGYCRSGNIRENLIFANIRELVASRIQSSH